MKYILIIICTLFILLLNGCSIQHIEVIKQNGDVVKSNVITFGLPIIY